MPGGWAGTLPTLLWRAAAAPLLGLALQSGQIQDGPHRPPSQLPPPLGLPGHPSGETLPSVCCRSTSSPVQSTSSSNYSFKTPENLHKTKLRATAAVTVVTAKPASVCSRRVRSPAPLSGHTCGRSIHARLTSPWGSSSDPERHCASVSGDRAVSGVSWKPSWKELSLLTTVLLLGSRWISGGQAYRLPTPATGTHSQKCNRKPLPPSPSTLISSSKRLRGPCPPGQLVHLPGGLARSSKSGSQSRLWPWPMLHRPLGVGYKVGNSRCTKRPLLWHARTHVSNPAFPSLSILLCLLLPAVAPGLSQGPRTLTNNEHLLTICWLNRYICEMECLHSICCSVAQSCPTVCDPVGCSTPGLPVHHHLPELAQTHVHRVGDAIQPSHPLSPPSPPTFNPSQHEGLFQERVSSSHQVAKALELQLQHQSWKSLEMNIQDSFFRMDWLDLHAVQGTLKRLLQHHSSKASILQHSAFFMVQLSHPYMTTGKTIALTRWTFVGKVMFQLFNMQSMLVIAFLPRSKHLLISWLQLPSAVVLEPPKMKSVTVLGVCLTSCPLNRWCYPVSPRKEGEKKTHLNGVKVIMYSSMTLQVFKLYSLYFLDFLFDKMHYTDGLPLKLSW